MTKEVISEQIKHQNPRLIYLSGKTCTGKSTFADILEKFGYKKIELDKIVMDSVVIPFGVATSDGFRTVYRDLGPIEQTRAFINAAKMRISKELQNSSLIVEGAIASPRVLGEIFSDSLKDFVFIYFHPIHTEIYEQQILSRFEAKAKTSNAGLPKDFWELVQGSDLEEFRSSGKVNPEIQNAIKKYAAKSMEESSTRLGHFKESFPNINVVEI